MLGGSILGVKFLDSLAGFLISSMILKAVVETGYQKVLISLPLQFIFACKFD